MSEKLEKEIVSTLQAYDGSYNGKYNKECLIVVEIFRLYDFSEKDYINNIEAVAQKQKTVDTKFLETLRQTLKQSYAKNQKKHSSLNTSLPKVTTKIASSFNKNKSTATSSSSQPPKSQIIYTKDTIQQLVKQLPTTSTTPSTAGKSSQNYLNRVKKGNVEVIFNKEHELSADQLETQSKISFSVISGSKEPFRYMYDKHAEKSDTLSDELMIFAEELLQKHQIEYTEPVGTIVGSETAFFGRILTDSKSSEDKLNLNSILLEGFGDVHSSKSALVKLQVDPTTIDHEFFPGQFVVVQGSMKDGKNLSISQIHSAIDLPVQTNTQEIQRNLRIIFANGPFTLEDDLQYTPLKDLLQVVQEKQPNILVLSGPFVDKTHPMIKDDTCLTMSFDEIFENLLKIISKGIPHTTQVILIPSLDDIFHDYVYPQPPFVIPQQYSHCISSVSNPCVIQCNGITIGVNTIDFIYQMSNRMYKTKPFKQVVDRALSCVKQCLDQNHFYPPRIPNEKIPLDYSQSKMLQMKSAPSILLCSSQREAFVREIKGTIAVNAKSLVMYGEGGLYGLIDIPKPTSQTVKEYNLISNASIKVVRI